MDGWWIECHHLKKGSAQTGLLVALVWPKKRAEALRVLMNSLGEGDKFRKFKAEPVDPKFLDTCKTMWPESFKD